MTRLHQNLAYGSYKVLGTLRLTFDGSTGGVENYRGGFTVDIEWNQGIVTQYRVCSRESRSATVRVNGETKTVLTM